MYLEEQIYTSISQINISIHIGVRRHIGTHLKLVACPRPARFARLTPLTPHRRAILVRAPRRSALWGPSQSLAGRRAFTRTGRVTRLGALAEILKNSVDKHTTILMYCKACFQNLHHDTILHVPWLSLTPKT